MMHQIYIRLFLVVNYKPLTIRVLSRVHRKVGGFCFINATLT